MSENIKKRKIQIGGFGESIKSGLSKAYGMSLGKVTGAAGTLSDIVTAPIKEAGEDAVDELSPLDSLKESLRKNKTPAQEAKEAYYNKPSVESGTEMEDGFRLFGEPEMWDLLYNEPCWIDPETGNFDLDTALTKLWHKWYIAESIADQLISFADVPDKDKNLDMEEALKFYLEKFGDDPEKRKNYDYFKEINERRKKGFITMQKQLELLHIDEHEDDIISFKDGVFEALQKSPTEQEINGNTEAGEFESSQAASKWWFCFIFKFITGPVGMLLLKLLPYFFKFLFTIYDAVSALLKPFTNGETYYFDKEGEAQVYKVPQYSQSFWPAFGYTVANYFGLVIPLDKFKHDWGPIYGKGKFGKLILSMAVVSFGLIMLGYISVFVFLLVFALYCGKTVSMFGDNIDEKKKEISQLKL